MARYNKGPFFEELLGDCQILESTTAAGTIGGH